MYWPNFKSDALRAVVFSLKKRHKSLKHNTKSLSCERVIEDSEEGRLEKLELVIEPLIHNTRFSLSMWEDRLLWVDAREYEKNKGWRWQWTSEGRLIGNVDGKALIGKIEESLSMCHDITNDDEARRTLSTIWDPALAKGPKEVRT